MGGFPGQVSDCRRHPNHIQAPGVCSLCLKERLLMLTNTIDDSKPAIFNTGCYSSSSSSPPYSSASSFSPAVVVMPPEESPVRRRNGSDEHVAVPLGFLLNGNGNVDLGLKKSRSVGCGPRIYKLNGNFNGNGGGDEKKKKEKSGKKGNIGFWKKLIHSTSKKTKSVLMHSSTMKDRSNDINSSSSRKF